MCHTIGVDVCLRPQRSHCELFNGLKQIQNDIDCGPCQTKYDKINIFVFLIKKKKQTTFWIFLDIDLRQVLLIVCFFGGAFVWPVAVWLCLFLEFCVLFERRGQMLSLEELKEA